MSHEISVTEKGIAECFTVGDPAWHRLGANVKQAVTWKEAIKLAHLDWMVEKHQLEYKGKPVNAYGTFRADSGDFLGAVGPDFQPIQNPECFNFVDTILQADGGAHYETAGALFNGRKVWVLARIPKDIRISGTDDITKNYYLFMNPHYTGSAIGRICSTRVVCNNTLQIAMREQGSIIRIRHTKNSEEQFQEAIKLVTACTEQIKDLDSLMNVLAKVQLNSKEIGQIIKMVYTKLDESVQEQNKAREVLEIFEDNDNNAFPSQRGTAYNLLNAFTKYEDHFVSSRKIGEETEDQARARKAMFGLGDVMKFQVLTAITKTIHENSLAKFDTNLISL